MSIIFYLLSIKLNKKVGSRCEKPLEFFWSDGSMVNLKFYSGGGPDNYHGTATIISQGCLLFIPTHGLDDEACLLALPFVCNLI